MTHNISGNSILNSRHRLGHVLILALLIGGCTNVIRPNFTQSLVELRAGAYTLDQDHAYLIFRIEHLGLSTVVGRFNSVDATLDFDPEQLSELVLDGIIETTSIDLNNEDLERRLRGSGWLDTAQFPQARFESKTVEPGDEGEFVINGDFTLRGITQPVSLMAAFKGGADNLLTGRYTLGFTATGQIARSDYGIDSLGALVADEVFIEIHAEFQRADPS